MSIMSSLLLFLLCVSMHTSNARHLGFIDKKIGKQFHFSSKVVEQRLERISIPLKEKLSLLEEELPTGQQHEENGANPFNETPGGASTQNTKGSETLPRDVEETKGKIAGNEVKMSSTDMGLQQTTKMKGLERRKRSMKESESHLTGETINSKENDVVADDVVVMDYEQPHRKPPIHNESP